MNSVCKNEKINKLLNEEMMRSEYMKIGTYLIIYNRLAKEFN